jgi:hypothetical protein
MQLTLLISAKNAIVNGADDNLPFHVDVSTTMWDHMKRVRFIPPAEAIVTDQKEKWGTVSKVANRLKGLKQLHIIIYYQTKGRCLYPGPTE